MSTGWDADLTGAVPTHDTAAFGGGIGSPSAPSVRTRPTTTTADETGTGLRRDELDEVVERVAARLEERIVEELERRSRQRGVTSWG